MADLERALEASIGSVWARMAKEYVALTESFTRFVESDLLALEATVANYRGPVARMNFAATGPVYVSVNFAVTENHATKSRITIYIAVDNRVDAERIDHAMAENLASLGRRQSSIWHGASVVREPLAHHVTANSTSEDAPSIIRARSLRTRLRRLIVLHRDTVIVGLLTSLGASILVIVLQLIGVIPVPG